MRCSSRDGAGSSSSKVRPPALGAGREDLGDELGERFGSAGEHDRPAALRQGVPVAGEHGIAGFVAFESQRPVVDREQRAGGQAGEVIGVGQSLALVEVVDPPHEAAFGVAPRAEVRHVQIADARQLGTGEPRRNLADALQPAEVRRTQEHERALSHELVLAIKVLRNEFELVAEPGLVRAIRGDHVHCPSIPDCCGRRALWDSTAIEKRLGPATHCPVG